jgi:mRNA interferase YafQ
MRQLVLTEKFKRSFRKFVKRDSKLQNRIAAALIQMQQDVFAGSLSTHKLTGKLQGLYACSCGYDCRIIFSDLNTDLQALPPIVHTVQQQGV